MKTPSFSDPDEPAVARGRASPVDPQAFSVASPSEGAAPYFADDATRKLAEFFRAKGLAALKEEDRLETWYDDWLAYQAEHRLYARLLSPEAFSSLGGRFDLLRLARFLEVFASFSPAHGYSLQVSFLGLFAILMGSNEGLKREAVAALEAGGVLALGVSERAHGADLFAGEFVARQAGPGRLAVAGTKYYIGNANVAVIISTLARKQGRAGGAAGRDKRAPFVLVALRPGRIAGLEPPRKIRTLGVRSAFVGAFEVKGHELPEADVIADGRRAWDAVFGTVTLGKFFLGFGSVGICEHAMAEAAAHLRGRTLYGRPAIEMPHLRSAMAMAYARLAAMKLYAYRALDYVQAASADDRRYLLFNAVQKAKVGTEGVKVVAMVAECVGARGLEADTYVEMALRDAQVIPAVEGSTHVNLGLAAQFVPRYFWRPRADLPAPPSLVAGQARPAENAYLFEARTGGIGTVAFPPFLRAYEGLLSVSNVRLFAGQARAFRTSLLAHRLRRRGRAGGGVPDSEAAMVLGRAMATVAYGQLVAENAGLLGVPPGLVSAMFHGLVADLSAIALELAASPRLDRVSRFLAGRIVTVPRTSAADWALVAARGAAFGNADATTGPG